MHSMAQTYSALGRYQDSLDLSKETLNFRIENCPDDHLEIGLAPAALTIYHKCSRQLYQATP